MVLSKKLTVADEKMKKSDNFSNGEFIF